MKIINITYIPDTNDISIAFSYEDGITKYSVKVLSLNYGDITTNITEMAADPVVISSINTRINELKQTKEFIPNLQ